MSEAQQACWCCPAPTPDLGWCSSPEGEMGHRADALAQDPTGEEETEGSD